MNQAGLLLFAHGARDPQWATPFHQVVQRLRQRCQPDMPVELAFLEFLSPDILSAGATLAALGCTEVAVVPLFLGAGGHVRRDVPALMAALQEKHPHVRWNLTPAAGETDAVVQALADSALSLALSASPSLP